MTLKTKYTTSYFKPWKDQVLAKVKKNRTYTKNKTKTNKTSTVWLRC